MIEYLTSPRANAVQQFFQTTSKKDLLGSYAWCQAVSAGLLPILSDFEISLRNSLHRALSQQYGGMDSFNWMMSTPHPRLATNPKASPIPAPHKMSKYMAEELSRIKDKLNRRRPASPDDMVAALNFGFWEQLINGLDHRSHRVINLQGHILTRTFPYAPDTATVPQSDPAFKNRVVSLLQQIREVRNRIGHHDSVWSCPEFDLYGKTGFFPRRPRHTVISLRMLADRITWFSGWIAPSITTYVHTSDHWASFQTLLSREALAVYRHTGGRVGTSELLFSLPSAPMSSHGSRRKRGGSKSPLLPFQINQYYF